MTAKRIIIWTWIARVVTLLGVLAGILAAAQQLPVEARDYAALAVSLLGAFAAWIYSFLPAKKARPPALPILILAGALMLSAGCPSNAAGYRALTVGVKVTNEAGKTLASVCKAKRLSCVDKLGTEDKVALRECLGDCPKALKHWVQIVKPAVGSGVEVTFRALEAARDKRECAKNKPKCKDWVYHLKGWGCTLIRAVTLWRDLLGKTAAERYLNLLASVESWVCS